MDVRWLRIAGIVEVATLLALLTNRFTVHWDVLTSSFGPLHGTAYLAVIALALLVPGLPRAARWWAVVPGVGGLLAVRAANRAVAER